MSSDVMDQGDPQVRQVDAACKNKFSWRWLEESVEFIDSKKVAQTVKLGDFIKKSKKTGIALCALCNYSEIKYGSSGKKALFAHFKSEDHIRNWEIKVRTNQTIEIVQIGEGSSTLVTGSREGTERSISERTMIAQAMVLGVIAENSLHLTMSPVLIKLAQELSKDPRVLDRLKMDRTSASCKMEYGLGETMVTQLIKIMKQQPFSLNIDEATSKSNHRRVLAILVSYYSSEHGSVQMEHLTSFDLVKVDTDSIYSKLVEFFRINDIPWKNLISILMDSCGVMRGSKNGLEIRIRKERTSDLLDIDGDICHHVHNSTKKFTAPFGYWVEKLFTDFYNDLKWSVDLKSYFSEVCELMGIKFTMPQRFLTHRWLSVYDAAVSTLRLFDAVVVFYYAFLPNREKMTYTAAKLIALAKHKVSFPARTRIDELLKLAAAKNVTDDGKARKERILLRVFKSKLKTLLVMNFYQAVLPLLKQYVMLFQSKEPMIHKIHDEIVRLFKQFLSCFVKPQIITSASTMKKLINLDICEGNLLPEKDRFLGHTARELLKGDGSKNPDVTRDFYEKVNKAFMDCAKYLQKKLPLANRTLVALSSIDPVVTGINASGAASRNLKVLKTLFPSVISPEEYDQYDLEVNSYMVDLALPAYVDEGKTLRVDEWWTKVFATSKYPRLSSVVEASLSIFHGPQVEASFNLMGDIMDNRSSRMTTATLSAVQTVKYKLNSRKTDAIEFFSSEEGKSSSLVNNMKTSNVRYRKMLESKKASKERRANLLSIPKSIISKQEHVRSVAESSKQALVSHQLKQKRKAALEALSAKRRKLNK